MLAHSPYKEKKSFNTLSLHSSGKYYNDFKKKNTESDANIAGFNIHDSMKSAFASYI